MSMLEPLIILVLGATVMCIVLSVFLPMIQVITSLSSAT
jgi:type II secretory pathway component PulF